MHNILIVICGEYGILIGFINRAGREKVSSPDRSCMFPLKGFTLSILYISVWWISLDYQIE
jgi:hypothetical protein